MKNELIRKIFLKSLNQDVIKIKPIIGKGDVNKIFIIDTSSKKLLLRMNAKDEGYPEFKKEEFCIKESKKRGVFGPNILCVGKYKNISYMVYEFIEGKSGEEIKNQNEIWFILGKYAKTINSIKVKGYGLKFSSRGNKFLESWSKYIDYNINSLNVEDRLLILKVYSKKQQDIIKKYFLSLKKNKFKIGLAHNDLSLRNVIVDKNNKAYLIDWGCAEANIVPHSEFVEILGAGHMDLKIPSNEEISYFLKGYGISSKKFELMKKDISKFLLLVSFDKVRWAIDKNPKQIKELSNIAKKRLDFAFKMNQD